MHCGVDNYMSNYSHKWRFAVHETALYVCNWFPIAELILYFQELNVPERDVESLLVSLILDNRIQGHIDQVNRLLERGDRSVNTIISTLYNAFRFWPAQDLFGYTPSCRSKGMKKYTAIEKWNTQLRSLYQTVANRIGWDSRGSVSFCFRGLQFCYCCWGQLGFGTFFRFLQNPPFIFHLKRDWCG